jgi:hypothetical protein
VSLGNGDGYAVSFFPGQPVWQCAASDAHDFYVEMHTAVGLLVHSASTRRRIPPSAGEDRSTPAVAD